MGGVYVCSEGGLPGVCVCVPGGVSAPVNGMTDRQV